MDTAPGDAVRVGVIGLGFGGRVVAPVFEETEGCELVDVVSPRDDAAVEALCARDDVDVVSIHSPPFMHVDHVRQVVEAGHAVACDKPFGRHTDDAMAMCDLVRDAGVVNILNFEFRYDPVRARLRRLALDGTLGDVQHFHCTSYMSISRTPLRRYGWLFDRTRGGGWIGAFGSHEVDFTRWSFGEVVAAAAELRTSIAERPDADGQVHACTAEDGFAATLRTERGVTVTIDSSFAAPVNLPPRLVVMGTEGLAETTGGTSITLRRADGSSEELQAAPPSDNPMLPPMRAWAAMVRDAVRAGATPPGAPTFADGLACVQVMDRLRS